MGFLLWLVMQNKDDKAEEKEEWDIRLLSNVDDQDAMMMNYLDDDDKEEE